MAHIFAGTIDTQGEWEVLSEQIDKTLTADKTYTIQCLQPTYLRLGDEVDGGNLIDRTNLFTVWTYDGSTDLYIKTNGTSTVIVSED